MKFEQLDIDNLESIDNRLKLAIKDLFNRVIREKNFYLEDVLNKIADDLLTGKFRITIPSDVTDEYNEKDGLSGIDEKEYIKNGNIQGRIIIFPNQLNQEYSELLKTLSHEFEHYVCQSNENMALNLEFLKSKKFNMNNVKKDEQATKLPKIGGFCGNILDLKSGFDFYEEGSTEIVASSLVDKKPVAYRNRIAFLNGVLKSFGKSIDDMKIARRNGNLSFLEEMIPEPFFSDIPNLENGLRNSLKHKENSYEKKAQLDNNLLGYIDFLYQSSNLKNLSEEEQNIVIENILETSIMGSSYEKAKYNKDKFTRELINMVNSSHKSKDQSTIEGEIPIVEKYTDER